MHKTLASAKLRLLYKVFESLGYSSKKIEGKRSEWRKGAYHLQTFPYAEKGVKITLHKDLRDAPPPTFKHKVIRRDKSLIQELETIHQKYRQFIKEEKLKETQNLLKPQ